MIWELKAKIIATGGTIDKDYPKTTGGYAFEIAEPAAERVLKRVRPVFEYDVASVLKKDSLDITSADREQILEACRRADAEKIVVTHGTDTMIETAKALGAVKGKAIVLVGAKLPERFKDSDADFNLGVAIGALNVLEEGVYVAMNGQVYAWDKCRRDMETGQFVGV